MVLAMFVSKMSAAYAICHNREEVVGSKLMVVDCHGHELFEVDAMSHGKYQFAIDDYTWSSRDRVNFLFNSTLKCSERKHSQIVRCLQIPDFYLFCRDNHFVMIQDNDFPHETIEDVLPLCFPANASLAKKNRVVAYNLLRIEQEEDAEELANFVFCLIVLAFAFCICLSQAKSKPKTYKPV